MVQVTTRSRPDRRSSGHLNPEGSGAAPILHAGRGSNPGLAPAFTDLRSRPVGSSTACRARRNSTLAQPSEDWALSCSAGHYGSPPMAPVKHDSIDSDIAKRYWWCWCDSQPQSGLSWANDGPSQRTASSADSDPVLVRSIPRQEARTSLGCADPAASSWTSLLEIGIRTGSSNNV